MKELEQKIKKNGFIYTRVSRYGNVAIYSQRETELDPIIAYEVFEIKSQKAGETRFGDTVVKREAKELFPHNEAFGKYAWTYKRLSRAEDKMLEIIKALSERKAN